MEENSPCVKPQKQRESSKSIEQALKEVFYVHRSVVRELQQDVEQTKANFDSEQTAKVKLAETVKQLQKDCDVLTEEKRNLQETINKMKARNESSVCETCIRLQASLASLQQAYDKAITVNIDSLDDQERLIRYLESRVRKKGRRTGKSFSSLETSSSESDGNSQRDNVGMEKPTKLSLLRKKFKKSRFTESKKSSSSYDQTSSPLKKNHLKKHSTTNKDTAQSNCKTFAIDTNSEPFPTEMREKNETHQKSNVFVAESFDPNTSFNTGRKRKRRSHNIFVDSDFSCQSDSCTDVVPETEFVFVPETLGVLTNEESEETQETIKAVGNDRSIRDVLESPKSNSDESCDSPTRGGNVINSRNMNVSFDSSDVESRDTVSKLNKKVSTKQKNESNFTKKKLPTEKTENVTDLKTNGSPKQKNEVTNTNHRLNKIVSQKTKNETVTDLKTNEIRDTNTRLNKIVSQKKKNEPVTDLKTNDQCALEASLNKTNFLKTNEIRDTNPRLNKIVLQKKKNEPVTDLKTNDQCALEASLNKTNFLKTNEIRDANPRLNKIVSQKKKNEPVTDLKTNDQCALEASLNKTNFLKTNEIRDANPRLNKIVLQKNKNETSVTVGDLNINKHETGFQSPEKSESLRKPRDGSKRRRRMYELEYLDGCPSSPVFIGTKSPSMFDEEEEQMENRDKHLPNLTLRDSESPVLVRLSHGENEILHEQITKPNPLSSLHANPTETVDLTFSPQTASFTTKTKSKKSKADSEISPMKKSKHLKSRKDSKHQSLEFISGHSSICDRQMRQSTLHQAFVSNPAHPHSLSPPTKPDEQADIEKAIRLSLQEIQNTKFCHEGINRVHENTRPLFKVPESPIKPGSKSHKLAHTESRFSPKAAKLCIDSRGNSEDFDETLPPENTCAPLSDQMDASMRVVAPQLNGSLDPDVTLTQFCQEDCESVEVNKMANEKNGRKCSKDKKIENEKHLTDNRRSSRDERLEQYVTERQNDGRQIDPVGKMINAKKFRKNHQKTPESCESEISLEESRADVSMDSVETNNNRSMIREESQSLPSSSRSYKFGSVKRLQLKRTSPTESNKGTLESVSPDADGDSDENTMKGVESSITNQTVTDRRKSPDGGNSSSSGTLRRNSFDDSFDRVPKKKDVDYAYVDVVRKKQERKNLQATTCQECYEYYKSTGMSEEEIKKRIADCSRHRARHLQPSTPEHFWSIGFPDTQECRERGYIQEETPSRAKPSAYRRRRKLQKCFKSKNEENGEEDL